jgi:hypothetical protein
MASELSSYKNVLFDLYNEPDSQSSEFQHFRSVAQQAIDAIRVHSDALVIVQYGYSYPSLGIWDGTKSDGYAAFEGNNLLTGYNIVYGLHLYSGILTWTPSGWTPPTGAWNDIEFMRNRMHELKIYEFKNIVKQAVFIGEVGGLKGNANEKVAFENFLKILTEWQISYAAFIFDVPTSSYALQTNTTALFPPNDLGNILIQYLQQVVPTSTFEINISNCINGSTTPSGIQTVNQGSTLTVAAIADTGYTFKNWLLDGVDAGSANPITVPADANHTLEAIFEQIVTPVPHPCALASATEGTVFMCYLPTVRRFRDRCLSKDLQNVYYGLSKYLAPIIKLLRR